MMEQETRSKRAFPRRPTSPWTSLLAWLSLPHLAVADSKTLKALGISIPPADRLCARINRMTWILGFALVGGLAWIGRGGWDWQTAMAVGTVFASNGYNRRQFGLGGEATSIVFALLLGSIGLAGAFGLAVPGTAAAVMVLFLHLGWTRIISRVPMSSASQR